MTRGAVFGLRWKKKRPCSTTWNSRPLESPPTCLNKNRISSAQTSRLARSVRPLTCDASSFNVTFSPLILYYQRFLFFSYNFKIIKQFAKKFAIINNLIMQYLRKVFIATLNFYDIYILITLSPQKYESVQVIQSR